MRKLLASLLLFLASPAFAISVAYNPTAVSEDNPVIALGGSVASGNAIEVYLAAYSCFTATVTDNINSGSYALVADYNTGGTSVCEFWIATNATGSPTISANTSGNYGTISAIAITGFSGTPTLDTSLTNTATGSSATEAIGVVTTHSNEIAFVGQYTASYVTGTPTGYTCMGGGCNGSSSGFYALEASPTTVTYSAPLNASASWYLALGGIYDNSGPAPGVNNTVMPPRFLGIGFGYSSGGGGSLTLNGSPANPAIGSLYTASLTPSGGSGIYACSQVSATPNTALWLSITPSCQLQGIAENAETETITEQVTDSSGSTATKSLSIMPATSGSLAVNTSTTLPVNATSGGYYAYPISIQGGSPPYACAWGNTQPWLVTPDCWIEGTPTSTGTYTFSGITVTDSAGNTVTYSPTVTIDSTLRLNVDYATDQVDCPPAIKGAWWQCQLLGWGGSGALSYSVTAGLPAWASVSSSTGLISGTPTASGNVSMTAKVADSSSHTFSASALVNVSNAAAVSRPGYNSSTSNGFFVLNGHLYDPNGYLFMPSGVDRAHFDSPSWASQTNGALSGANVTREFFGFGLYSQTGAQMASQITNEYVDNGIVPVVTCTSVQTAFTGSVSGTTLTVSAVNATASTSNGGVIVYGPNGGNGSAYIAGSGISGSYYILSQLTGTSGSTGTYQLSGSPGTISSEAMTTVVGTSGSIDPNSVVGCVNEIDSVESSLASVQSNIIINIANEWGNTGNNSAAVWQSTYETAVSSMRTAGYTAPLLIDAMNYAEDWTPLSGGQASNVLNADSLKNVIFDYHLYNTTAVQANITNISNATNAVITFAYAGATNPWSTLTYFFGNVYVSGVAGMTQINGQLVPMSSIGSCSAGSCTLNTSLNTSSYSAYTSGGVVTDGNQYAERASSLGSYVASGIPILVGEYGPPGYPANACTGHNYMDNQSVAEALLTGALQAYGVPHINWAWDDNDQGGGVTSYDCAFGDTLNGPGTYALNAPSDLTKAGMDVTLNPRAGFYATGVPSTVLH